MHACVRYARELSLIQPRGRKRWPVPHGAAVAVWHVLASDPCSEPAAHRPPFSAPGSDQDQPGRSSYLRES